MKLDLHSLYHNRLSLQPTYDPWLNTRVLAATMKMWEWQNTVHGKKWNYVFFPSVRKSPFLVWMRRLNPFLQFVWININLQSQHKANDKFHWIHHDLQYQNTHISLINKLINILLLKVKLKVRSSNIWFRSLLHIFTVFGCK